MSNRRVALKIFVEHGNEPKSTYAMDSLKRAMRWDEEKYGREYDLDIFMIVAVSEFNFGAMENKGLDKLWETIERHHKLLKASGARDARRRDQQIRWMWALVEDRMMGRLKANPAVKTLIPALEKDIGAGKITPVVAMERLLAAVGMQ